MKKVAKLLETLLTFRDFDPRSFKDFDNIPVQYRDHTCFFMHLHLPGPEVAV